MYLLPIIYYIHYCQIILLLSCTQNNFLYFVDEKILFQNCKTEYNAFINNKTENVVEYKISTSN